MRIFITLFCFLMAFAGNAQVSDKRNLSKQEVGFLAHKVDSIKRNLNRMIIYEKELLQRNYFLNEKTALVDELISTLQYLQRVQDIAIITRADVKKIFGKSKTTMPGKIIYDIETYQSNCPFMEISFSYKENDIIKTDYRITDCQKWK